MKRNATAWVVGAVCVSACSLLAFVTNIGPPWPNGNVVLHLQLGSSPTYTDGTNPNSTGVAALQHWNGYMNRVQLLANSGSNANKAEGNGINNVFFSSAIYGKSFSPGVLAVTLISSNSTNRTETDVIANSTWTWDSYRGPLASTGAIDLRRVLIHEFGHVLGLGHPDEAGQYVEAIMNAHISRLDGTTQDDQDGVASFYGRGVANPAVAPSIPASEPSDQTAETGSYLTFYVNAQGTRPLTLQWYKDDVAIPGATERSLNLQAVRPADSGGYFVRVTNEAGSATSRTATLRVNPPKPPSIVASHPQDQTVTETVRVGWSVGVDGTQPMAFQWRKDGVDIPGATSNLFIIDSVQLSDAGLYSLQATNEVGTSLSREARLKVNPGQPPTILSWPQPISTTVGFAASLSVSVTSPLPLTYQWLKDGEPLSYGTDRSLYFSPADSGHEGSYSVVVSTEFGSVTSPAVTLTVYPALRPPVTLVSAETRAVQIGKRLQLSIQYFSSAGLTYQWYHNGHPIRGADGRNYFLASATLDDAGEYYAIVSSDTGSTATTRVIVTVEAAATPDREWLSYQRDGDIVYFLFAEPGRIERFNVSADAWLPSIALPRTPTGMTVHNESIFVAFGSQISRFPLGGGSETALGTGPDVISSLVGYGDFLFGLAAAPENRNVLFSFGVLTGAIGQSISLSYLNAPSLVVDPVNRRVVVRTASPPGIPAAINFDLSGSFFIGGPQGEIYRGGLPHDRMYLSSDSRHLVVQAGTVYRASDLTFVDAVGGHFDDAAFFADGTLVVLRNDKLVTYSKSWAETGSASLSGVGDVITVEGSEVIVFTSPLEAGAAIGWERISLDRFVSEEPPPAIDSEHLLFEPDGVWLAADGSVLIYSREHQHVLRWSVDEQKYLVPIPVLGDADRVWYSRNYDLLYASFPDREIRTISLDGLATEEHFASVAEDLLELVEMGESLLAVDTFSPFGPSFRILARNGQQTARNTPWANYSASYTWNASKRRLYYFEGGGSGRSLQSIELFTDGTIGNRVRMNSNSVTLENLRPPIFIPPAGDLLLLGSGRFFDAESFEVKPYGLVNRIDDAVWQGTTLFTATSRLSGVEVQRWAGAEFGLDRTQTLPGRLLRIFALNSNQLLVVTSYISEVHFTVLDHELTVQSRFPGVRQQKSRLINVSTRGEVGTDSGVMIAGFVVSGNQPKRVLIRGIGPTLESFNVDGVLPDPVLTIFDRQSSPIANNDDWGESDPAELVDAFQTTGAFRLSAGSTDAAMILTLQPGSYTAVVDGKDGRTGIALVEVYDLEPTASEHRLINISTRARVGTGSAVLIPGLVIAGPEPKRLLIRAVGPGLMRFGISWSEILANPSLEIVDRPGNIVAGNDNWGLGNASAIRSAAEVTGAFTLQSNSSDAALVVMLAPGQYTVVVRGSNNSTGVALVEAYELP